MTTTRASHLYWMRENPAGARTSAGRNTPVRRTRPLVVVRDVPDQPSSDCLGGLLGRRNIRFPHATVSWRR